MLRNIVTVGPLLAGVSALLALALTMTKSALLRRREETLRKVLESLEEGTRHHTTVSQLHRKNVAAIIAREAHGAWRFIWPWLVWLLTAALAGQSGFYLGKFIDSDRPFDVNTFAFEVFGGDAATLIMLLAYFPLLAIVFRTYEHSLFERARTTRGFYNAGVVTARPPTLYGYMRERGKGFWWFTASLAPGLGVFAVGLAAGTNIYLRTSAEVDVEPTTLTTTAFLVTLAAVFLLVATAFIAIEVRDHRRRIELLPWPRIPVVLRQRRARANLGIETRVQRAKNPR